MFRGIGKNMIMKNTLTAPLSTNLLKEHKISRMPIRRGDTVAIMRGSFKGAEGKVTKVNSFKGWVYVEGVTRESADGSAIQVPINASKVAIRQLLLDDKRRKEIIDRRTAGLQIAFEEKVRGQREAKTPEAKEGD